MKNINKDIEQKDIKQFYVLYGEEDYLKLQYRDKLVKALVDPEDNMNYTYYEGAGTDAQSFLETAETLPFFSDARVIVVENSGWLEKPDKCPKAIEKERKASSKKIEKYIVFDESPLPDSTHVIFVEKSIDKRGRFYKWLAEHGYVSEMNAPDAKMLTAWIKGLCKAENKQIEDEALSYFIENMGIDKTNMLLMKNELEKLFNYCIDQNVIKKEDIKAVCVSQATDKMFAMLDAIGSRNQEKALMLYHDFLALKEPAMRVLTMLTRHFRIMMKVKMLSGEGHNNKSIASICGVQEFAVRKAASQAEKYTSESLKNMVSQCQDTDYKIKTGQIKDTIGVELLIVEFSKK